MDTETVEILGDMGIDLEETQVISETLKATLVQIQEPKQLGHQYLLII